MPLKELGESGVAGVMELGLEARGRFRGKSGRLRLWRKVCACLVDTGESCLGGNVPYDAVV